MQLLEHVWLLRAVKESHARSRSLNWADLSVLLRAVKESHARSRSLNWADLSVLLRRKTILPLREALSLREAILLLQGDCGRHPRRGHLMWLQLTVALLRTATFSLRRVLRNHFWLDMWLLLDCAALLSRNGGSGHRLRIKYLIR
jgi:hypothetical protein